MRIAVISDVHGNLPALAAVLAAIGAEGADLTVNLGDLLSGYVQPAQTADRLIAAGLVTVRGNHERQVLTFAPERMGMADRLTSEVITAEHREWMASLPMLVEPAPGVLAFHGTPTDDLQYLLHTVTAAGARGGGRVWTRWCSVWVTCRAIGWCCAGTPIWPGRCGCRTGPWW
ncbi:metallophosphoesterase [Actinoplanes sp. NPDC024001]|uniref:metallophosphoesterase family protein n=1 Tax=Actinoplanes sp. NPDC024001 TaxID=3154598 RepID=UPI00340D6F99